METEWIVASCLVPLICGFSAGFLPITILSWGNFYLWRRRRLKERQKEYETWLEKCKIENEYWDKVLEDLQRSDNGD